MRCYVFNRYYGNDFLSQLRIAARKDKTKPRNPNISIATAAITKINYEVLLRKIRI